MVTYEGISSVPPPPYFYRQPVTALLLNLTALPQNLPNRFEGEVTCLVDFDAIDMARPSDEMLERAYEIPTEATTTLRFQL